MTYVATSRVPVDSPNCDPPCSSVDCASTCRSLPTFLFGIGLITRDCSGYTAQTLHNHRWAGNLSASSLLTLSNPRTYIPRTLVLARPSLHAMLVLECKLIHSAAFSSSSGVLPQRSSWPRRQSSIGNASALVSSIRICSRRKIYRFVHTVTS